MSLRIAVVFQLQHFNPSLSARGAPGTDERNEDIGFRPFEIRVVARELVGDLAVAVIEWIETVPNSVIKRVKNEGTEIFFHFSFPPGSAR
jgi:hypothetical protein